MSPLPKPCVHWWHHPAGWVWFSGLLLWNLVNTANFWTERVQMWGQWQQYWSAQIQQNLAEELRELRLLRAQLANEAQAYALLKHQLSPASRPEHRKFTKPLFKK